MRKVPQLLLTCLSERSVGSASLVGKVSPGSPTSASSHYTQAVVCQNPRDCDKLCGLAIMHTLSSFLHLQLQQVVLGKGPQEVQFDPKLIL